MKVLNEREQLGKGRAYKILKPKSMATPSRAPGGIINCLQYFLSGGWLNVEKIVSILSILKRIKRFNIYLEESDIFLKRENTSMFQYLLQRKINSLINKLVNQRPKSRPYWLISVCFQAAMLIIWKGKYWLLNGIFLLCFQSKYICICCRNAVEKKRPVRGWKKNIHIIDRDNEISQFLYSPRLDSVEVTVLSLLFRKPCNTQKEIPSLPWVNKGPL